MLRVILGDKDLKQCTEGKKHISSTDTFFEIRFQTEWLKDPIVKDILAAIHNVNRIEGTTLYEKYGGKPMTLDDISVCCRIILLIYRYPEIIFTARLNTESLPMLEKIAGFQDITVHVKTAYSFPFCNVDEIEIVNYGKTVHNSGELEAVYREFEEYERLHRRY